MRSNTRCIDLSTNKGQVTIFIIVGIIVAAIFFFVISTTTEIQNEKLQSEKEKVVTKVFRKEALRIAVDDCLKDEMSHALIVLGKQGGKFWAGEPGGIEAFNDGINGITVASAEGESKVMYGITKGTEKYPCISNPADPADPAACINSYKFPSQASDVGYGARPLLTKGYIESQLQAYMVAKGGTCVERVLKEKVGAVDIINSVPKIEVSLTDEGINVKANYEMTLSIAGVEQFELTQFDFTYPTAFNRFLRAAVTNPLKWDWKYVDFKFDQATLNKDNINFPFASPIDIVGADCVQENPIIPHNPLFNCRKPTFHDDWDQLQITMVKREIPDSHGDDLFLYTMPIEMIAPGAEEAVDQYEFVIARQNRPPALDYISRNACPGENGYDYLVIPGSTDVGTDGTPLGEVKISFNARDPDEDSVSEEEIKYQFRSNPDSPWIGVIENQFDLSPLLPNNPPLRVVGDFTYFDVSSKDKHEARDEQEIKIFIDQGLSSSLKGSLMADTSTVVTSSGNNGPLIISREDPIKITLELPEQSESRTIKNLKVIYTSKTIPLHTEELFKIQDLETSFASPLSVGIPASTSEESGSMIEDYLVESNIIDISGSKLASLDIGDGTIDVQYTSSYCNGASDQIATVSIDVNVVECLAHDNPDYPFSYPFNNIKEETSEAGSSQYSLNPPDESNPFTATHSCCITPTPANADTKIGQIAGPEQECGQNVPDCYGKIQGLTKVNDDPNSFGGYVLEKQSIMCTGNRGNYCDGSRKYELVRNAKGLMLCGKNSQNCIRSIPTACQNNPAYGYVDTNNDNKLDSWCNGKMGCEKPCSGPVVYTGDGAALNMIEVNKKAQRDPYFKDSDALKYFCGCANHNEKSCDSNFDGTFGGTCNAGGNCIGDDEGDPAAP